MSEEESVEGKKEGLGVGQHSQKEGKSLGVVSEVSQ
jgi:hypothetical protein